MRLRFLALAQGVAAGGTMMVLTPGCGAEAGKDGAVDFAVVAVELQEATRSLADDGWPVWIETCSNVCGYAGCPCEGRSETAPVCFSATGPRMARSELRCNR